MIRGLFINQKKAQCSIYEAGVLIKNCLSGNSNYVLDYIETDAKLAGVNLTDYDFYIINWHFITLSIPKLLLQLLQGFKIAIMLEVGANEYAPHPWDEFDAHMIIDPTKIREGKNFPFPRPLPIAKEIRPILDENKLVLGSFGFVGYNLLNEKRFEEIISCANAFSQESIVRFNFPSATFIEDAGEAQKQYDEYLTQFAEPHVEVRITHDYFDEQELISWLSEHTMNCFPYYRKRPGLSAVTDQSIAAGRAIAVTGCATFRHLHRYIRPYSSAEFIERTVDTLPGVAQMQIDWRPQNFANKFIELLTEKGVL